MEIKKPPDKYRTMKCPLKSIIKDGFNIEFRLKEYQPIILFL